MKTILFDPARKHFVDPNWVFSNNYLSIPNCTRTLKLKWQGNLMPKYDCLPCTIVESDDRQLIGASIHFSTQYYTHYLEQASNGECYFNVTGTFKYKGILKFCPSNN